MVENEQIQLAQCVSVIKNRPFSLFRVDMVEKGGISVVKLDRVNDKATAITIRSDSLFSRSRGLSANG
jgi:hypothetical protein